MIQLLLGIFFLSQTFELPDLKSASYEIDFNDPKSVLGAIFHAARERDFAVLQGLCDPDGAGDGDVKQICAVSELAEEVKKNPGDKKLKQELEEFISYFKKGKITGEVIYKSYKGDDYAMVPFWFNHPIGADRSNETMEFVRRDGKWYLYSF